MRGMKTITRERTDMKVYGSDLCPDCFEATENFDFNGLEYEFINITDSMRTLKEFLKLRDTREEFAEAKAAGLVGIPAIVREDGSITLDWEGYLEEEGFPVVFHHIWEE